MRAEQSPSGLPQTALGIASIAFSLAITSILILAVGAHPIAVFEKVMEGAFRDWRAFSGVANFWIPLTLASIGLVITFTAGLWNIGVEGQMIMGAIFASAVALNVSLPAPILIPLELLAAMTGGALWGAAVGWLKVRFGINEIFGGVALNKLAEILVIALISGPWQPPEGGSVRATPPFPADALLPPMHSEFEVSLLMVLVVVVVFVACLLALRGTRWGLQLKATGKNARSALLLGVPTERSVISALVVCGLVAGLGGAYRVLFTFGNMRPYPSGGIGFLALLVVLVLSMRLIWVPLVALIFSAILSGSARLKIALQLDASLAGALQGILVLVVLLFNGLRQRLQERRKVDLTPQPPLQWVGEGEQDK